MKRYLTILLLIISTFAVAQNICVDSSIHERYSTQLPLSDSLMFHKQTKTFDGGTFTIGHIKATKANGDAIVIRTNKYGTMEWSKRIASNPFSGYIAIETVEEAHNGNIHIIAKFNNGTYDGRPPFHLLVLSPNGDVIGQKRFGFTNSPNLNNKSVRASLILRKGTDSLLYILSGQVNAFTENQVFLVTADNSGIIGPSVIINAQPSGGWDFPVFRYGTLDGGQLTLYGSSGFIGQCANRPAFFSITIDMGNKSVLSNKAYCAPENSALSAGYQAPRDFFSTEAYDKTFIQPNGNIVMARAYNGVVPDPSGMTNKLFSISTFDPSFNHLHSEYVATGDMMRDKTVQEIFVDSAGTSHFSFYDFKNRTIYYALAGPSNTFFLQKKIPLPSSKQYTDFTRNSIADNRYLVNFTVLSYDNSSTHIDRFRVLANDTSQVCFGTDTAFLSFTPAQVSAIDWQSQFWGEDGALEEQPLNFFSVDYPLLRTIICKIVSRCDSIKINAPDTICNMSQPVLVTAYKNPLCKGKVVFTFDTALVRSYQQINDTTLSLTFNKSGKLKIFAQPSACDRLKDSAEIMVYAPVPLIDLGSDAIYCPGRTYLLDASSPDFKTYQWQDGSMGNIYFVSAPGTYSVMATDHCDRQYFDTIRIMGKDFGIALGKDSTICKSESMILSVPAGYLSYNWAPSYKTTHLDPNKIEVSPEISTSYTVEIEVFNGCKISDTINIVVGDCDQYLYFPTGFTPNNDGLNDRFRPIAGGGIIKYELQIYDRWGQLVFRTTDKTSGLDGKFKGHVQDNGVFVWQCKYQFYGKQEKLMNGTVMLVR
ncbi:MAG: gliding motility-associated C-terminal domain-containing protein [Bacteroidetes bacterium]|nr:gliding motility-associated C-terminal domain-containing protein [Bacteroidota bacterium]